MITKNILSCFSLPPGLSWNADWRIANLAVATHVILAFLVVLADDYLTFAAVEVDALRVCVAGWASDTFWICVAGWHVILVMGLAKYTISTTPPSSLRTFNLYQL